MSKTHLFLAALAGALVLSSCSSGIDFPSGSIGDATSARLIQKNPSAQTTSEEAVVHRMIQNSLKSQFTSRGLSYGEPGAELVVAYLVVFQDNAMTTYFDDYFGSSHDAEAISDAAHMRGIVQEEGGREAYERAGIVVDVLNASTNEVLYRNYATGNVVRGVSSSQRAARVNDAVNRAIAPFFK